MKKYSFLFFLLFFSCGDDSNQKIATEYTPTNAPTNQVWGMTTTITDSGKVSSVIKAGYVTKYSRTDAKKTFLDSGIVVEFYDQASGKLTSVLTAKKGIIDDLTKDMEAMIMVKVNSENGTILETEYLKWTKSTQLVTSDQYVKITKPNQVLTGTGFQSDRKLQNFKIFKASGEAELGK